MRIMQWDESGADRLPSVVAAAQAAQRVDDPAGPPLSTARVRSGLSQRANHVKEIWYTDDEAGSSPVTGWYCLVLPQQENQHLGFLDITVHPDHRRRGLGTALLRHAAERAAAHGRSALAGEPFRDTAGDQFAKAAGARAGVTEAKRRLDITAIPPGLIASLRQSAERAAVGYTLTSFTGTVPDEHLAGVAYVLEAMNDAPSDHEGKRWDAGRVREEINVEVERRGNRCYTVVAIHDETGQMAGLSEVEVDPESPEWGFQEDTAVARPHRGHRLGLLLKTAMLEWLAAQEPALKTIETGNAASNQYMIAINEQLGFTVAHPWWQAYDIPVASVLS
jgi:GNAT superfamily N-acetyltransferase